MKLKHLFALILILLHINPVYAADPSTGCYIEADVMQIERIPFKNEIGILHRASLEIVGKSGFLAFNPNFCEGKFEDGYRFQAIITDKAIKEGERIKGKLIFKKDTALSGYHLENVGILSTDFFGVNMPTLNGALNLGIKNIAFVAVLLLILIYFILMATRAIH